MLKKRFCRICGDTFYVEPKQASRAYCDRNECQLERRRIKNEREKKRYTSTKRRVKKVRTKPDVGRRCRRCGGNCYPNYFFCPECHHYVSRNEWRCAEDDMDAA